MQDMRAPFGNSPKVFRGLAALCLLTAAVVLAGSVKAVGQTDNPQPRRTIVGIWSYYDPDSNKELCKLELKKDGTYEKTTRIGVNGLKTTPGNWRFDGKILVLLYIHGNGRVDRMERGRVVKWKSDDMIEYKVIDGYEPAGRPGQVYELRRV
jgi:hypothetical protein